MGNNRIYWACPFYKGDTPEQVRCEGCAISLPEKAEQREYIRTFCADHLGWRRCTIARAMLMHYDALFEAKELQLTSRPAL